jgi:hypothetical protein
MRALYPLHRSMKRFISICTIIYGTQQYYILVHIVNVASYISYGPLLEAADTGRCFCYQCCNVVIGKLGKLVHTKKLFSHDIKKKIYNIIIVQVRRITIEAKEVVYIILFQ